MLYLDTVCDVEGCPGEQEEQQGDGVHPGGPALLPGHHHPGTGHPPPHAGAQVRHQTALALQDGLRLGARGSRHLPGESGGRLGGVIDGGAEGVLFVGLGNLGEPPHVGAGEVQGSHEVTGRDTDEERKSFHLKPYCKRLKRASGNMPDGAMLWMDVKRVLLIQLGLFPEFKVNDHDLLS